MTPKPRILSAMLLAFAGALSTTVVHAESNGYSWPWQLRPVKMETAARFDGMLAAFNDPSGNLVWSARRG